MRRVFAALLVAAGGLVVLAEAPAAADCLIMRPQFPPEITFHPEHCLP